VRTLTRRPRQLTASLTGQISTHQHPHLPLPVRWVPLEMEPRLRARAGQAGTHGSDRCSPHSLDPGWMQSCQRLCALGCRWVESIGWAGWQGNGVAVTAL